MTGLDKRMQRHLYPVTAVMTKAMLWMACLSLLLMVMPVEARQIVDMTGRKVEVPDRIRKVYATSPPATQMIYAVDPGLLSGWNAPLKDREKRYLSPLVHDLPVLGGYFGQGRVANIETIIKAGPDVVIMWVRRDSALNRRMEADMKKAGFPLVFMAIDGMADYGKGFRFLGKLLDREERAEKLADYGERALKEAAAVARSASTRKTVSVYYAQGLDGLFTECHTSRRTEVIGLAGAGNVCLCRTRNDYGMERVSMEEVLLADPDVIFVQERQAYDRIRRDRAWRRIGAVRDGRVFVIPKTPFNWFDRPASHMRYIGIKWVMSCLYPDLYPIDMARETRLFYRLFLGVELDDAQVREILAG